jgi:hypothetical protein
VPDRVRRGGDCRGRHGSPGMGRPHCRPTAKLHGPARQHAR